MYVDVYINNGESEREREAERGRERERDREEGRSQFLAPPLLRPALAVFADTLLCHSNILSSL